MQVFQLKRLKEREKQISAKSITQTRDVLIQISPKNVIYILRSLLSFVNDKV